MPHLVAPSADGTVVCPDNSAVGYLERVSIAAGVSERLE